MILSDFVNNTIANAQAPHIDLEMDVQGILAAGINKARINRNQILNKARYDAANSGYTRDNFISNDRIIEASRGYISEINETATRAIHFAQSAQTQIAQALGQLITPQLQVDIELQVEQVQLASKEAVAIINMQTEKGIAGIQADGEVAVNKIQVQNKIDTNTIDISGELASKMIEVNYQVDTTKQTEILKAQNAVAVSLIDVAAQYQVDDNMLQAQITGLGYSAHAELQGAQDIMIAHNNASKAQTSAKLSAAMLTDNARINAAQAVGNADISSDDYLASATVTAQSSKNIAALSAYSITAQARNQAQITDAYAHLKAQDVISQARLDAMAGEDSAKLAAAQLDASAKLKAQNLTITAKSTAVSIDFDASIQAKGITNTQSLNDAQAMVTLRKAIDTTSNTVKVDNVKAQNTQTLIAQTNNYIASEKALVAEGNQQNTLLGITNKTQQVAQNTHNSSQLYSMTQDNSGKVAAMTSDYSAKTTIEEMRTALETGIANAQVSNQTANTTSQLNQRTAAAALDAATRKLAKTNEDQAQLTAIINKETAQQSLSKTKATTQLSNATQAETVQTQIQAQIHASQLISSSKEFAGGQAAALNNSNASIAYAKQVGQDRVSNAQLITSAQISALSDEMAARLAAAGIEDDAKIYAQSKGDTVKYEAQLLTLQFDAMKDAQNAYMQAFVQLQKQLADKNIAQKNQIQYSDIINTTISPAS